MIETHPIPALAKTAFGLLEAEYRRQYSRVATQTIEAMGFVDGPEWTVDVTAGTLTRVVPDPAASEPPA